MFLTEHNQRSPITQPKRGPFFSFLELNVVLKRKSDKDFKKVGPICGNLYYKSQLTKVWVVLSCGEFNSKLPKPIDNFFLSN